MHVDEMYVKLPSFYNYVIEPDLFRLSNLFLARDNYYFNIYF